MTITHLPPLGDDTPEDRPQRKWIELFWPNPVPPRPEAFDLLLAEKDRHRAYVRQHGKESLGGEQAWRGEISCNLKIGALVAVATKEMAIASPEDAAVLAAEEARIEAQIEKNRSAEEARVAAARERARARQERAEMEAAGRDRTDSPVESEEDRRADKVAAALGEELRKHGGKVVHLKREERAGRSEERRERVEEPKKPPREPVLISALELYRTPFPPIDWVIEGCLVAGTLSILAGKPKIGKSFLALQAALAVARGKDFLGMPAPVLGPVWYLGLEDSPRRLNYRITGQLGAGVEPPACLGVAVWWPRMGLDWIARIMSEIGRPRLIVIDTYARFRARAGRGASGNMYETQYDDLEPLIDFCQEQGVAILLIHHTNKAGGADVFDRISGSVALQGAVDTMMVLDRERIASETGAVLSVHARDFEGFETSLEFEKVAGTWKSLGPTAVRRTSDEQEAILAVLRGAGGSCGTALIVETLVKEKKTVLRSLQRMVKARLVARGGTQTRAIWSVVE